MQCHYKRQPCPQQMRTPVNFRLAAARRHQDQVHATNWKSIVNISTSRKKNNNNQKRKHSENGNSLNRNRNRIRIGVIWINLTGKCGELISVFVYCVHKNCLYTRFEVQQHSARKTPSSRPHECETCVAFDFFCIYLHLPHISLMLTLCLFQIDFASCSQR